MVRRAQLAAAVSGGLLLSIGGGLLFRPGAGGGDGGGSFVPNAVDFPPEVLLRSQFGGFTTNGTEGTFSWWFRFPSGLSDPLAIFADGDSFTLVRVLANGKLSTQFRGDNGFHKMQSENALAPDTWHHIAGAISGTEGLLYVDGAEDFDAAEYVNDIGAGEIWFANTWYIGGYAAASCHSEPWFERTFRDLSVETNLRKFITADGKPVNLGADGSTPFGSVPDLYLPNDAATVEVNAGSGTDFVRIGEPVACASAPGG